MIFGRMPNEQTEQRDPQTYAIIGAAQRVHSELGHGFLELVYRQAMEVELQDHSIPYASEVELPVLYKGVMLDASYRADLVCFESVVVELKAIRTLTGQDEAQLLNYLKA